MRYRAWRERVARVEVLDTQIQERQSQAVVIRATVRYVMRSGTVTEERHRFHLVTDPTTQRWLSGSAAASYPDDIQDFPPCFLLV
jgi:hypothetical protein